MDLSVVSPVYYGEFLVSELVKRIEQTCSILGVQYEIILVEDGSPDKSWEAITTAVNSSKHVVGVKLSRNFGQHAAIFCGLAQSKGKYTVVMDCDLQDRPEEIARLFAEIKIGHTDLILARRMIRQHSLLKRLTSSFFYFVYSYLTGTKTDGTVGNFGIYNRKVIDAVLKLGDKRKAFPLMVNWVGFKTGKIDVSHGERYAGKSTYNWRKLINLALDIALSFSEKPMKLMMKMGLLIFSTTLILAAIMLWKFINGSIGVPGYTSIILSIWLFCGLIIFCLGLSGLYIARIFEGVKDRPAYIVDKHISINEN